MAVHIDYNQGVIRNILGEYGDTFDCSASLFKLSPETVYIYNFIGKTSTEFYSGLHAQLLRDGVTKVLAYFPTKWISKEFQKLEGTDLHIRYLK